MGKGGRPAGDVKPHYGVGWGGGRGTFSSNRVLGGGGRDEGFARCGSLGSAACCFSGSDPLPALLPPPVMFGVGKRGTLVCRGIYWHCRRSSFNTYPMKAARHLRAGVEGVVVVEACFFLGPEAIGPPKKFLRCLFPPTLFSPIFQM